MAHKNIMKKLQTKIWILTGILLLSISANAMAQDTSFVTIEATVEDGCTWSGTPFLSTSSLTVADNEICIIQGAGRAALNVTVDDDTDSLGQAGGKLIIGGISTSTTFTVGGLFNANGIVEIGATGNPAFSSELISNGTLNLSTIGSDGDFDIIENTNGSNSVDINTNAINVGTAGNAATFTNNDDATSTFYGFEVYGTFENLHASGIITTDGTSSSRFRSGSTLDNDGTMNLDSDFSMYGAVSADNSGIINITNGAFFIGTNDIGTVTFNNSGEINVLTAGNWFMAQYSTAFTNTGDVTTTMFLVQHSAIFDNDSGGAIDARDGSNGGFFVVFGDVAAGDGTFNNNSGATVIADQTWIMDPDFGTGPNYTDRPTLNNNDGATFTTDSIDFSWDDLGDWLGGLVVYGAILNNDGAFTVTDSGAAAVSMYRGAKLNNTSNGTFTMSGTTAELLMSKSTGGAYTSECGATDDTKCQITNTNVTDLDAFDVSGQISMWQYSELNNNGNMVTRGANNIDILENNASVINGANGDFELAGTTEQVFNFDVTVDNDGAMYTNSTALEMADTASLDNASGATLTVGGAGRDLTLNDSSSITSAGDITVPDDTIINDDAYINQSAGTFTTIDLLLTDTTLTTPYLTMTGGTLTASADVKIDEASIVNVNGGTLTGDTLYIGDVATSQDGGTLNIDLTGAVSILTGGRNHVYKGTLDIKSTSTAAAPFTFDDRLHLDGDALEKGIVNHYGSGTVSGVNVPYIYKYGELNIGDGVGPHTSTWDQNNSNIYVFADPTATIFGELNIGSNGTLYDVQLLDAGAYNYSGYGGAGNQPGGTITNYGTIQYEGTDYITLRRGGKLDNYGTIDLNSASGRFTMEQNEGYARTSYFINQTGASLTVNDFFSYHPDHIIDNDATITVKDDFYLGSSTYEGGIFNNRTSNSLLQVADRLYIYKGGVLNNDSDALVGGISVGTLAYDDNYQALKYDNISTNWPNFSQTVTGGTSGATATIVAWDHNITDGVLFITGIAGGPFLDGETLQGSSWGTSTADGTVVANEEFTAGDTITGSSSGATATIDSTDPLDTGAGVTSGTLAVSNVSGTFTTAEAIIGASQGSALTNGAVSGIDPMSLIIISGTDAGLNKATFYQDEGTTTDTKTTTTSMTIGPNGAFYNDDKMTLGTTGALTINSGGLLEQRLGASNTQDSLTTIYTGTVNNGGSIVVNGDATDAATFTMTNALNILTGGSVSIDGIINQTGTAGNNIRVDGGNFESGTDSVINLSGIPGIETSLNTSTTELAGTVTSGSTLLNEGGEMCLGQWDTGLGGGASNCIDSGSTITLSNLHLKTLNNGTSNAAEAHIASDVVIQGDLDIDSAATTSYATVIQNAGSYLQITNNGNLNINVGTAGDNATFTSNGHMDIQGSGAGNHGHIRVTHDGAVNLNYTGADYDIGSLQLMATSGLNSSITLGAGATMNLNDYHGTNEVITANNTNGTGSATFTTNGTTNMNSGATQDLILGYSVSTSGTGEVEIGNGGSLQHTNGSAGTVDINATGRLEIIDDSNADLDADFNGTCTVGGDYADGTGNRGAYIGGELECETTLTIEASSFMDVGSGGVVTVAGSTTSVYGNVELDGTLNAGDLTVYSGGVISSGDGNPTTTGSGCGVGGNFGCGTSTAFYINATNLDIQSGGAISSDAISVMNPGSFGAGSHIGEGEGKTGTGNTYGKVKLDEAGTPTYGDSTNTPDYGQAGANLALAPDGHGGGGVRIYTNGNFTNNGTISANGEASTGGFGAGAGGTVIIVQNPSATGAYFIGTGDITANGGAEGASTLAGGGGLVIIKSPLLDDPDFSSYDMGEDGGSVTALPGAGGGAAGAMVYLGDRHNDDTSASVYGTLIVDQGVITSTVQTEIPTTGNDDFARIEARGDADVVLDATAVDPTSCFDLGASNTVTGVTCTSNPDKPDTLLVFETWEGSPAQSTDEPGYNNPANGVGNTDLQVADVGPAFRMMFRNPDDTAGNYAVAEIQVATDSTFSTLVWDGTVGGTHGEIDLTTAVSDNEWTEDIEYAGDTLSKTPTVPVYYVRARFRETALDSPGLWTHGDYNNQYRFEIISGSNISVEDCNDDPNGMKLTQEGTVPGTDMGPTSGERHGYGTCDVHVSTTETDWEVYYSMSTGETDFDNGLGYSFAQTTDCAIPTDGTGTEAESGYQLITTTDTTDNTTINSNVGSDTQCSAICTLDNAYNAPGCYFDFELIGTRDTIFDTDNGSASALNDGIFKIEGHANATFGISSGSYSLDTTVTLTANP